MEAIGGLVAQSRSADRELLGTEQLAWLMNAFNSQDAKWNVLGQQVLMSRMELPSSVMLAMFQLFNATDEQKMDCTSRGEQCDFKLPCRSKFRYD